jgi:hypothetical protein
MSSDIRRELSDIYDLNTLLAFVEKQAQMR